MLIEIKINLAVNFSLNYSMLENKVEKEKVHMILYIYIIMTSTYFLFCLFCYFFFMHFMFCNISLSGCVSISSFIYPLIIYCCPFLSFGWIISFLFFLVCKGDWGILFLKNFSKMPSKKGQKFLLFCLKLFEYPLMKFNNFKP